MCQSSICGYFRPVALALFVLLVSIPQSHAADGGEAARTWVSAIVTVAGLGWICRRTFKAADFYEIWYGTNRHERIANTFDNTFGTKIHYGKCRVSIPRGHVFGSIGSSPFKRWFQRLVSGTDDRLAVTSLSQLSAAEFEKGIGIRLARFDSNERSVLVFIHGYNVKFSEAAIRAAQIGFDLKVPGVMALFSWPSKADVRAYLSDADSVAASEPYLIEFINRISSASSGAKINIIAHSMGNLGLLRALATGLADSRLKKVKFGQIFLAAPDIDVNLFRQLATVYLHCSENTTLYISAIDRALLASRCIHRNQRTGYSPPVTVIEGIDTVEATEIDIGILGHGYYAAAAPVLYDMATLIRKYLPPQKRPGLYPATTSQGDKYWVIRHQNV
jgi:esterase/lipase superfamily enzyme